MRKGPSDLLRYFLLPWIGSTLAFLVVMWWRDPMDLSGSWNVGIVVAGVFGIFCFLAYLTYSGKVRIGLWRDFL